MMITTFEVTKQDDIAPVITGIRGSSVVSPDIIATVQEIVDAVRERGDDALLELTLRFDGVDLGDANLEVPEAERKAAWDTLDPEARLALTKARSRISSFASRSLEPDWEIEAAPGLTVGQVHRPLDTVGIYVPGGRYPYPSTVLMTGLLASEAGVGEVVFCIPPGTDGSESAATMAATTLVGDCRVFRAGGAQAIAAMAYGTGTVPRCSMIAGPGNVYVATAKRLLSGVVSIDLDAGPSEVAAYVDASVDISFPSVDLLAQLEHDPLSLAVMVSESPGVLQAARGVLEGFAEGITEEEGPRGAICMVRCASRELSVSFLNEMAPEHLELMVEEASDLLPEIRSAGCVFIGPYSPVVLGDYIAGPSHVLPTAGTASRLSGLAAGDFRRTMNVVSYTREGFKADAPEARLLAGLEGLGHHALSVDIRNR